MKINANDLIFKSTLCMRIKIILDGQDITDKCFSADEDKGEAVIYLVDINGKIKAQTRRVTGNIDILKEVVPREEFDKHYVRRCSIRERIQKALSKKHWMA